MHVAPRIEEAEQLLSSRPFVNSFGLLCGKNLVDCDPKIEFNIWKKDDKRIISLNNSVIDFEEKIIDVNSANLIVAYVNLM